MPWIHAHVLALAAVAGSSGLAFSEGVDLSKVDRSIRREPAWTSGEPQYCLFVVSAERRVWFVVDGDDLYMDINENGDLADPGEKLPRRELSSEKRREAGNSSRWRIPDIRGIEGGPMITNIQIDLDTNRGAAFGSKFVYFDSPHRRHVFTRPTFSNNPADAPILHPRGPVRLEVKVKPFLRLGAAAGTGRERVATHAFHVMGQLYVDGLGPGTRFLIGTPTLNSRIEFPLSGGATKVHEMQLEHSVDGGLYQSNSATHPEGSIDGAVKITVSMPASARGLTAAPVVVEKPLAELRAAPRENKPAAVDRAPSREPLALDADEAAAALAWHGGGAMVFSPDRSRRATSTGNEQTVVIRNEESGETVVTFREQPTRIYSLAFSPDGKRVASGGLDGSIKVWDAASGEVQLALAGHVPRLKGYSAIVHDVAVSPDGAQLASAGADGTVRLWDAATGKELRVFRRPVRYVNSAECLAFSPNGKRLAAAYDDGTILLWDVVSGKESLAMKRKSYGVKCLTFSPDGARLASAARRGDVNVWDAESGEHSLRLTGHKHWAWGLAFSPDGKRLGLADAQPDRPVLVWDVTPDPAP
jgi:hypothetical protein